MKWYSQGLWTVKPNFQVTTGHTYHLVMNLEPWFV